MSTGLCQQLLKYQVYCLQISIIMFVNNKQIELFHWQMGRKEYERRYALAILSIGSAKMCSYSYVNSKFAQTSVKSSTLMFT